MTRLRPFDYEVFHRARRHEPSGYQDYQSLKPWLRDEFVFRCIYCLFRETWYPHGSESFSVDHLVPRSVLGGKELECEYKNLVYSCIHCNSSRGVNTILNPNDHYFDDHLSINESNGQLEGLSPLGVETINLLGLNRPDFVGRRNYSFSILSLKDNYPNDPEIHKLFVQEFGFPYDLPDLRSLKPPKGNPSNSQESCYYVLRERGELPEIY
jgi:HNH endonuclease